MRNNLYSVLACPNCGSEFTKEKEELACKKCHKVYPIVDNIPNFLARSNKHSLDESSQEHVQVEVQPLLRRIYRKITFSHTYKTKESRDRIPSLLRKLTQQDVAINIGAGNTRHSKNLINIDIERTENVDIIADSRNLPILDHSVDLIISQAVLEHTPQTSVNIHEMHRVLKDGGLVYCEVPFMQTYHAHPHDYFRFTHEGLKDIFKEFHIEDYGIAVGPSSAFSLSFRTFIATLLSFGNKSLFLVVGLFANWVTFPIKYLDFFLESSPLSHYMASGIYIVVRKKA